MRIFLAVLLILSTLLLSVCIVKSIPSKPSDDEITIAESYVAVNYENVKAMWISQYDLLSVYTNGNGQRDETDFRGRIVRILTNIKGLGFNTVFVQVRPFADSFFPSEIYPVSSYVSGEYGKGISYDPFRIILNEAHAIGLSVHAWINPLRAMTENEITSIDGVYKIREWYDDPLKRGRYIVAVDGRLYLNPAYDEARALVGEGASEIVRKYDVDGVHIDDYFYPTTDESFDIFAYQRYINTGGELSLAEFRRENINSLIKAIYDAVKAENESVLFGVSPAGVMKNNYEMLYADVRHWCANKGYIDYLCPQIYFGFEHSTCAFDKLCNEFSDMVKLDGIKLIFGMTLGKAKSEYDAYAGEGKYEWRDNKDVLYRALKYTESIENCSGVSYFCYQYFYDPLTGERVEETVAEIEKFIPLLKMITWCEK